MRGLLRGLLIAAAATAVPVYAAEVRLLEPSSGVKLIVVQGKLELGDEKTFANIAVQVDHAIVAFASPGGNLHAGLGIGEAIYLKKFVTVVLPDDTCASACALAWLAGQKRFAAPTANIGFHAASDVKDGRTSAPANAVVGAYLNKLGLSTRAIYALTESPPTDMRWFSSRIARELGIEVETFDPDERNKSGPQIASRGTDAVPRPPASSGVGPAGPEPLQGTPASPVMPEGTPYAGLNLTQGSDVRRVQSRLIELGYHSGTADGTWGPRSRVALREFKRQNGLVADDRLTAEAGQLLLETGQARRAAPGYVLPDPRLDAVGLFASVEPPAGARLSPLNPTDAIAIQERLQALGYYRRAGEGTWGDGSRAALADFAVASGYAPRDGWSAEVERALFSASAPRRSSTVLGSWIPSGSSCSEASRRSQLSVAIGTRITSNGDLCAPVIRPAQGRYIEISDSCTGRSALYQQVGPQLVRLNASGSADSLSRCDEF